MIFAIVIPIMLPFSPHFPAISKAESLVGRMAAVPSGALNTCDMEEIFDTLGSTNIDAKKKNVYTLERKLSTMDVPHLCQFA